MKKIKWTTGWIGLLVIAALVWWLRKDRLNDASKNHPANVAPVAVEVEKIGLSDLVETVKAVGTSEAWQDVTVSSETSGRITRVLIDVGESVRTGQVMVEVDDELRAIAVDQAQAQLLAAETQQQKALKDLQRLEKLSGSQGVSDSDRETAQLGLRAAEAQLKGAQVALRLAQRQLADCQIKSPCSGMVAAKYVEAGELVAPGRQIADLIDLHRIKVRMTIPEEQIVAIDKGQPARINLEARADITFDGMVSSVGGKSTLPEGHAYPVEVSFDNTMPELLKAGMFARIEIETSRARQVVAVAKESLIEENDLPALFVVDGEIARLRPVRTGLQSENRVQILSGVQVGDRVIIFGQKKLKDGARVKCN